MTWPSPERGRVLAERAWPALAGLALGLLALGPGLRPGFLLSIAPQVICLAVAGRMAAALVVGDP